MAEAPLSGVGMGRVTGAEPLGVIATTKGGV
jgi:hypothetical protein